MNDDFKEELKDAYAEIERLRKLKVSNSDTLSKDAPIENLGQIAKLSEELERLRAALRKIAEGDIPRPVAKPYRTDGTPSKNDQCEHGQWMYEECGQCIEQFARAALEGKAKLKITDLDLCKRYFQRH